MLEFVSVFQDFILPEERKLNFNNNENRNSRNKARATKNKNKEKDYSKRGNVISSFVKDYYDFLPFYR